MTTPLVTTYIVRHVDRAVTYGIGPTMDEAERQFVKAGGKLKTLRPSWGRLAFTHAEGLKWELGMGGTVDVPAQGNEAINTECNRFDYW